jgi:lipopolysaccharide/colanic/teichoic acid biosynthesis glycosyltransferase
MSRGSAVASGGSSVAERALALLLLALCLPLLSVLAFAVLIADRGPVLYRGLRLGRGKKPFLMYKLRTLRVDANRIVGGELLNHTHDLTIPGGQVLRDTRLDELPQLWNVVRGEMRFVGPRPERPEVYALKCREIPGYEQRFAVLPGLIGISQLFTPHGTPKRYRTLIDNAMLQGGSGLAWVVPFTALTIVFKAVVHLLEQIWTGVVLGRWLGRFAEKRRMRRRKPRGGLAHLRGAASGRPIVARIVDMNEQAVLVECQGDAGEDLEAGVLFEIPVDRGGSLPAWRSVHCTSYLTHQRRGGSGARLVLQYRPLTPRGDYMVHQYFLRSSLAPPRAVWRGPKTMPKPPVLRAAASVRRHAVPLGSAPLG